MPRITKSETFAIPSNLVFDIISNHSFFMNTFKSIKEIKLGEIKESRTIQFNFNLIKDYYLDASLLMKRSEYIVCSVIESNVFSEFKVSILFDRISANQTKLNLVVDLEFLPYTPLSVRNIILDKNKDIFSFLKQNQDSLNRREGLLNG